jgi:hypothetical protein
VIELIYLRIKVLNYRRETKKAYSWYYCDELRMIGLWVNITTCSRPFEAMLT